MPVSARSRALRRMSAALLPSPAVHWIGVLGNVTAVASGATVSCASATVRCVVNPLSEGTSVPAPVPCWMSWRIRFSMR